MAKKHRKRVINRKHGSVEIIFEFIILFLLIKPMFSLGFITGIVYIFAIGISLINRSFFKKRKMMRLIVFGTLLSYLAGRLFLLFYSEFKTGGELITIAILVLVTIFVWYKGFKMRKG